MEQIISALFVVLTIIMFYYGFFEDRKSNNKSANSNEPQTSRTVTKSNKRYWFARLIILFWGLVAIMVGWQLLYSLWSGSTFLGAFLFVTGAQVVLWVVGVRLEILGNIPTDINTFSSTQLPPSQVSERDK